MARRFKILTGLSTIAVTGALALSGCGAEGAPASNSAVLPAQGEGEGEGAPQAAAAIAAPGAIPAAASTEGEGGVDIAAASRDPVVFGSALAIAEAHVLAARDAYAAGRAEEAASMFAHPVSEVLADMEGAFIARGVVPFNELFIDASAAVLEAESVDAIAARTGNIIAALREAGNKAPDNGASEAAIAVGVTADQVERAVAMYRLAASSGEYGPYLDGYGFYKAAQSSFERGKTAIDAENPDAAGTIAAALAALAAAYPAATAPSAINADIAGLSAASSRVMLSTRR